MGQSDVLPLTHSTYNAQLFKTSVFSDCTIKSGHRIWHLHRCILSPRCEFFWSCFQGSFEEANTANVEMHDDDPETLGRLLQWIYTLEYPRTKADQPWTSDLSLYLMADKYGLTNLMTDVKTALLDTAESCNGDRDYFRDTIDDFCEAVEMLFNVDHPDFETLRKDFIKSMSTTLGTEVRTIPELSQLMIDVPEFGVCLVESLAIRSPSITSHGSSYGQSPTLSPEKVYIPLNEDSEDEG